MSFTLSLFLLTKNIVLLSFSSVRLACLFLVLVFTYDIVILGF
mgnify:CR=1 FL=1